MFSNEDFATWMIDESIGSAVILGGALVDEELLLLLLRALPSTDKEDGLFDPERPLGAFSARIKLAHRLSLIDDDFAKGLNVLRDIRNDVAHGFKLISLNSNSLRDRIANLSRWVSTNDHYPTALEALREHRPNSDPLHRHFAICIVGIVMRLRNARASIEPLRANVCLSISARKGK
ncbi:hypothetical protein [Burkholderia gladioli]|uniref:hypothetical protein n=1 Tax=Burkholderia gladioli TaxID=28095 RepID=UPI001FC84C19|nr:hypothetical protein [Burkholderia gladioli]